jgi:predicted nucleic acid-binding Zn ribbon protein
MEKLHKERRTQRDQHIVYFHALVLGRVLVMEGYDRRAKGWSLTVIN